MVYNPAEYSPISFVAASMTREEFSATVHQWYDPLYRFALSLCRDPDNALDLTQNAFQKLAKNTQKLRDSKKVKPWLFSVLHREFIDDYRHATRFPKTSLELVGPLPSETTVDHATALDVQEMLLALGKLDAKFRAPLSLFYIEEFSYKEIAETLSIPIGTVMSRLRRAKDHLRAMIDDTEATQPSSRPIQFPRKEQHG